MIKKILLPTILVILAYGFWISPDFKQIAAGVSVFLFGMYFLEEGFRTFTGGTLETILRHSTNRMWKSLGFGVVTTTLMQSSSLVSVITISFLSAGLIDLYAGLGIIFGANLGTTTGAWLVAGFGLKVKISAYAMPMLVFGCILNFQKNKTLKGVGFILAGLGFLFLGIHFMKEGFETFKDSIDLTQFAMTGFKGLVVFSGIGVLATVIMQSSHATLVIIITALAAHQITYSNALALAVGANVGTTITAMIGSMNTNVDGRRLAGGHLIFNLLTGIIAMVFMPAFVVSVDRVSAACGIAGDDYTLKLAVFHTLFNLVGVIIMLPISRWLVHMLHRALPEKRRLSTTPRFLNDAVMEFPETLLNAMRNELFHLYENAFEILSHGISLHRHDILSSEDLEPLVATHREIMDIDIDEQYSLNVKSLYAAIIAFSSAAQQHTTPDNVEKLLAYRNAGQHISEAVKAIKHLNKNMRRFLKSRNPDIRSEYDFLRRRVALVLRDISTLRSSDQEALPLSLSYIENIKVRMKTNDHIADKHIDLLIRSDKITPEMASSLLNDSSYAEAVIRNLLAFVEIMFKPQRATDMEAELEFELSEEERETIAHKRSGPEPTA